MCCTLLRGDVGHGARDSSAGADGACRRHEKPSLHCPRTVDRVARRGSRRLQVCGCVSRGVDYLLQPILESSTCHSPWLSICVSLHPRRQAHITQTRVLRLSDCPAASFVCGRRHKDSEGPGYGFVSFLLGEGTALIALGAAGIRFVFDWQVRYWLFFLEFVAGLLVVLLVLFYPAIFASVQNFLRS